MTQASFMMAWRLKGLKVLIVGGGKEADGRLRLAQNAGANIYHVAPSFTPLGEELGQAGQIKLFRRTVKSSDL